MRNPCEKCRKRDSCSEICPKLARLLPGVNQGSDKREISVDPARIEKYSENIKITGLNPDVLTDRWHRGKV